MAKVSLRINSGGIAAAANMFATDSDAQPDHSRDGDGTRSPADGTGAARGRLRSQRPRSSSSASYNDIALYRELIRNGISEYMVAAGRDAGHPDGHGVDLRRPGCRAAWPQHRLHRCEGRRRLVSTIAHNCAWGISNLFSTETILADLDLPYGTANIDFDQDPPQGIAEAVFAPERLDEVFLDRLLTKCSEHLSLLAAPSMLDRAYDFDGQALSAGPRNPAAQRAGHPCSTFRMLWSDWTRSVLAEADEVVIAAVPDLANLRNAKNLLDALKQAAPER